MILAALVVAFQAENVKQISDLVKSAYSHCQTYRDIGTSEILIKGDKGGAENQSMSFSTIFKRPGKLRFEFKEYDKDLKRTVLYVLWATGKREMHEFRPTDNLDPPPYKELVWLADDFDGRDGSYERNETLGMAIAGFTGISHGVAHTVPRLFFPEDVGGLDYFSEKDLKLLGEVSSNGVPCFLLETKSAETKLWIRKKDYLLVKTVEESDLGDFDEPKRHITTLQTVI